MSNKQNRSNKYLTPFQRKLLERDLSEELTDKQRQRIKIMLLADERKTQAQICQKLSCCQATARHWITIAKNGQAHNWRSNPIGRPILVSEEYMQRLKELVNRNPREVNVPNKDYQYPFKRWTGEKLSQHLDAEFRIKITPQHINRLLKQMGLSTRSKPPTETENNCAIKRIQIRDLDSVSISEASEIWHFKPLI